jgi:hypothetical protein
VLKQQQDRDDLVRLGLARPLAAHDVLGACLRRHPVQRPPSRAAIRRASRGFSVDGNDLGHGGGRDPFAQSFPQAVKDCAKARHRWR